MELRVLGVQGGLGLAETLGKVGQPLVAVLVLVLVPPGHPLLAVFGERADVGQAGQGIQGGVADGGVGVAEQFDQRVDGLLVQQALEGGDNGDADGLVALGVGGELDELGGYPLLFVRDQGLARGLSHGGLAAGEHGDQRSDVVVFSALAADRLGDGDLSGGVGRVGQEGARDLDGLGVGAGQKQVGGLRFRLGVARRVGELAAEGLELQFLGGVQGLAGGCGRLRQGEGQEAQGRRAQKDKC